MRYFMLVYLSRMSRTLAEAEQYLQETANDDLRADLLENGRQMLTQIRTALEYNQYDIEADCPELAFISQSYES